LRYWGTIRRRSRMNERKTQDRRKIERRAGKRGVTVRVDDKNPNDVKRVRRGQSK
jgi:hypothetical protein